MSGIKSTVLTIVTLCAFFMSAPVLAGDRFLDNGDGTVTDHQLGVMWAKTDNQGNINWNDANQWVKAAKEAGMRYVVFTTKHHDGFCMFDTKTTDYKITSKKCSFHTHPRAHITKEIFNEFRKEDFLIGAYFSKPDWYCKYYWWPYYATPNRHVNYNPAKHPKLNPDLHGWPLCRKTPARRPPAAHNAWRTRPPIRHRGAQKTGLL